MSVVAEGIEEAERVEALLSLGATEGQGFLYSPAIDAVSFERVCRSNFIRPPTSVDQNQGYIEVKEVA